jgi:hypothetical protein
MITMCILVLANFPGFDTLIAMTACSVHLGGHGLGVRW